MDKKYILFSKYLGCNVLYKDKTYRLSGLTDYNCSSPVAILSDGTETTKNAFIHDCELQLKNLLTITQNDIEEFLEIIFGKVNIEKIVKNNSSVIVYFIANYQNKAIVIDDVNIIGDLWHFHSWDNSHLIKVFNFLRQKGYKIQTDFEI